MNFDTFDSEFCDINDKLPADIHRYYCSPLMRCSKLAERLAKEIQIDDRLKELDFIGKIKNGVNLIIKNFLNGLNFVNVFFEFYLDLHKRTI